MMLLAAFIYTKSRNIFLTIVLVKIELKVGVTKYMFLHVRM